LLKLFYSKEWCTGSGGGISIRINDSKIFVAPSGIQKEMLSPDDI